MSIIWTIIIGFLAGVIAKFIMPGDNEPSGFVMTTILGIVGAFVASYLGQALDWYKPGEGAVWSAPSWGRSSYYWFTASLLGSGEQFDLLDRRENEVLACSRDIVLAAVDLRDRRP